MVRAGAPPQAVWGRALAAAAGSAPASGGGTDLALDDLQHLPADVLAGLTYHLDKLPAGLRLLLATRGRWPVALGRLAAAGKVAVRDEAWLRFSPAEADAFVRDRVPALADDPAFRERVRALGGWPLGLATLAAEPSPCARGRGQAAESGSPGDDALPAALAAFVAEELVAQADAPMRGFLLRAALLEDPSAEALRAVFDFPDAADRLAWLADRHLARRTGDSWTLPPHLRAWLRAEAARSLPADELRGWHRWAAEHYRAAGREALAIPHLLACRDWPAATNACAAAFPRMRHDGSQDLIGQWLAAFPPEAVARDPRLLVWHGTALARDGRLPEGLAAFDRALAAYRLAGDRAGQFAVRVRQANIALARQEARAFAEYLLAAQSLAEGAHPEDLADLALIRGHAAEQKGDLTGFRAFNEQVLVQPDDGGLELAASRYIAHVNLYTWHLHRGLYREAHGHLERAIAIAQDRGFGPYLLAARLQRVHLFLTEGRPAEAETALAALPEGWRDQLDWHDLACAHAVIGHLHAARGEWAAAETALRASMTSFDRIGLIEGKKIPLEHLLWIAVRKQEPGRIAPLLETIAGAGETASPSIYDLALVLPRARAALQAGDAAGALALALEAAAGLAALEAARHLAQARLIEAAARRRLDDRAGARAAYEAADAAIQKHGYGFLRQADPTLWAELAPLASTDRPAAGSDAAVAPAPAGDTKGLSLRLLGGCDIAVDGVPVTQWPRQTSKAVLVALALYPRGLSLVELAEHVSDGEAGSLTRFKVAVSTLRKVLEPDVANARDTRFVVTAGDRYTLDPEHLAFVDLRAFETGLTLAERLRSEDPTAAAARLAEALALYGGDLLDAPGLRDRFEAEREALRHKARAGFLRLAALQGGTPAAAERTLARAALLLPADEAIALALVQLLAGLDRPDKARQAYWDCRKARKSALGLPPGDELEAAFRALPQA